MDAPFDLPTIPGKCDLKANFIALKGISSGLFVHEALHFSFSFPSGHSGVEGYLPSLDTAIHCSSGQLIGPNPKHCIDASSRSIPDADGIAGLGYAVDACMGVERSRCAMLAVSGPGKGQNAATVE